LLLSQRSSTRVLLTKDDGITKVIFSLGRKPAVTNRRKRTAPVHIETLPISLLLVDDDPIPAIQSAPTDFRLKIADNDIEAYRYISGAGLYANRTAYPLPNVILLNLNMPRFNGLQFLRWLRLHGPEDSRSIPVIILSASTPEEIQHARALGARMLAPKPIDWSEFWQELVEVGPLKTE
jgi:CheY-like chemotaxis protein